jgi:hypothetical protein
LVLVREVANSEPNLCYTGTKEYSRTSSNFDRFSGSGVASWPVTQSTLVVSTQNNKHFAERRYHENYS